MELYMREKAEWEDQYAQWVVDRPIEFEARCREV